MAVNRVKKEDKGEKFNVSELKKIIKEIKPL